MENALPPSRLPASSGRRLILSLMVFTGVILACLYFAPRLNPPYPIIHGFRIEAGEVARAVVIPASRTTGRATMSIQPQSLEYESSSGPVTITVVPFALRSNAKEDYAEGVDKMLEISDLLKSGGQPETALVQSIAESGTIPLNWWPYGHRRYFVFLQTKQTSDVRLTVRYGPRK